MSRRLEREIARRLKERGEAEPPADLLGRIQAEIPDSLKIGLDDAADLRAVRRPAARRVWLAAASLAAMVGAGVLSYRLFETDRALFSAPKAETAPAAAPASTPPIPPIASSPSENRLAAPRAVPATPPPPPAPLPASPRKQQRAAEGTSHSRVPEEPEGAAGGVPGGVVGGVPGGVLGGEPAGAPPPEAAPAPAPAAPGAADVQEKKAEPRLAQKAAPATALGNSAADRAEGAAPASPQAKSALAQPERFRAAGKVAAPASSPEAAPSPFPGEGRRIFLLLPPEAEATFDPAMVARSARVGSSGPGVLYEVELRPGAPAEAVLAGRNGETLLRVRDLAPSFERATPGLRLAALEAELAAVQTGTRPRSELPELRRLARTLAAELPADPRAAALLSRLDRLSP